MDASKAPLKLAPTRQPHRKRVETSCAGCVNRVKGVRAPARPHGFHRYVGAQVSADSDELDPVTTMPKVADPPGLTDPL